MLNSNLLKLDERMTEETKNFVTNFLNNGRPTDILAKDINEVRQERIKAAKKINETISFDNLEVTEFEIDSKYDSFKIPITSYKPLNNDITSDNKIVLFFHGGGWSLGNRETFKLSVCKLAESTKSCWIYVEYRLAPEWRFPTQLNDCVSVFKWLTENKLKFSSNLNSKICVCGDSAGGHIGALLTNEYYKMVDYQVLIYPCIDFSTIYESEVEFANEMYILIPQVRRFYRKNLLDDDRSLFNSSKLSPILNENLSFIPNTLIIAAELDPIRDHAVAYYEKLLENNVKCELKIIKGVIHGFFRNPNIFKEAFSQLQESIVTFLS